MAPRGTSPPPIDLATVRMSGSTSSRSTANIRPVRTLPGTKHGISGQFSQVWQPDKVDMVIIREGTEGLYSGIGERDAARATDTRVITRRASERVIRKAFEVSRQRGKGAPADKKKRVTCIVKHNVLQGCRLFLETFRDVAKDFPDIEPDVATSPVERETAPAVTPVAVMLAAVCVWLPASLVNDHTASVPVIALAHEPVGESGCGAASTAASTWPASASTSASS